MHGAIVAAEVHNDENLAHAWLLLLREGSHEQKVEARAQLAAIFERRGMLTESIDLLVTNVQYGAGTVGYFLWLSRLYREQGEIILSLQTAAIAKSMQAGMTTPTHDAVLPVPVRSVPIPHCGPARTARALTPPYRQLALTVAVAMMVGVVASCSAFMSRSPLTLAVSAPPPAAPLTEQMRVQTPQPVARTELGNGVAVHAPFSLRGGAYAVDWIAYRGVRDGGPFVVKLRAVGVDDRFVELVNTTIAVREPFREQVTEEIQIPGGEYYLEVVAPSNWVLTLEPR